MSAFQLRWHFKFQFKIKHARFSPSVFLYIYHPTFFPFRCFSSPFIYFHFPEEALDGSENLEPGPFMRSSSSPYNNLLFVFYKKTLLRRLMFYSRYISFILYACHNCIDLQVFHFILFYKKQHKVQDVQTAF